MLKDEYKVYEDKMKKSIDHLEEEFATIRAGRANPAVLDHIMVNYYDTPTPINQLAAVAGRRTSAWLHHGILSCVLSADNAQDYQNG